MALQKTAIPINFAKGVDTKTDPYQLQLGTFAALNNMQFGTTNRLTKRNGFGNLTKLPNALQTTLTTLNDNLIATGSNLYAYSSDTDAWLDQGSVQPVSLDVMTLSRSSTSQTSPDAAIAPNGLICTAYSDSGGGAYYQISDSVTGQQVKERTLLSLTASNARVFILGKYFIVSYTATVAAASHLQYISIPISMPNSPNTAVDISTALVSLDAGYDAYVVGTSMYIAWSESGNQVQLAVLTSTLGLTSPVSLVGQGDLLSVTADTSGVSPTIWVSFWDSVGGNGYAAAFTPQLAPILILTPFVAATVLNELTSIASDGVLTIIYENDNEYAAPYPTAGVKTDYISTVTVSEAGSVGTPGIVLRSVGLASKAFVGASGKLYVVVTYGEINQPTYFLIDLDGNIFMRLAYSNGGGYQDTQVLPTVTNIDDVYYMPYEFQAFLATVNKTTNIVPAPSTINAIYTQMGVNLAKFSIDTVGQYSSEIAGVLNLTGGQVWMYDGLDPVEQNFHVWPENVAFSTATVGGAIQKQLYYYSFVYEWTDAQGMLHRSAPSIPTKVDITASATNTNENTLYVPTLRLTYKTSVRIVGYRWSLAQQTYYQFTSITNPYINDPSVDFITITDTLADSAILGQTLLYTTGGVIENIAPPPSIASTLFNNRYWIIDAENRNLLWYSKQVIQNVPVEMSDLFTLYIAPTTGSQGSTGYLSAISAMDDKLIAFKANAIYYVTGKGPDNTGANNDFSDPVFITGAAGCANQNSIVMTPMGLMFQSDKGIWMLGRDLSTKYIGAPVEKYNEETVVAALAIPGTNQIRFTLTNNITLMYDYYYDQWATFSNLQGISSTLYQGLHTYLDRFGQIFQESEGKYLDGSSPVLMSFTTSWINVAGLQGFQRFYHVYLLGTYYTPFKLQVQLSYDYSVGTNQSVIVMPDNYGPSWGGDAQWGSNVTWGGPSNVFEPRVFPEKQKCESFQMAVTEVYDPSFGVPAGQGLSLSGLNMVIGVKKGFRTNKASQSFG